MQKVFLYFMLVIMFLGLSKALSPSEFGVDYVPNEKGLSRVIPGQNVTVILTDMHATGFLIKTYYQKYRLVHGFQNVEELIVRTSRDFAKKNKKNIGLSLFRRYDKVESTLPVAPGLDFVGNRAFGEWEIGEDQQMHWQFYRSYKNLPSYFGWGQWTPDLAFYENYISHKERGRLFFGTNHEFGTQGWITKQNFPNFFKPERQQRVELRTLLVKYFRENF